MVSITAAVMEEMSSTSGPRQDRVTALCAEFMSEIKVSFADLSCAQVLIFVQFCTTPTELE